MIRIIHLIPSLEFGGAEMMLCKLVTTSNAKEFEHSVITMMDHGALKERLLQAGINVISLHMNRGIPSFRAFFNLIAELKRRRPHILQTWLYPADLMGVLAGKMAHIPHIVWNIRCTAMDARHYSFLSRCVRPIAALLSSIPSAVIVNSHTGLNDHSVLGYHPKQWQLIPNGFDIDRFAPNPTLRKRVREDLAINDSARLISLIARVDPMKDHETFFKAANNIAAQFPDAYFLLAGKGTEASNPSIVAMAETYGIKERIFLLGPRQDIHALLNATDILVLSSRFGEGFPNILGEAMACGIPCVATDVGDAAYIIGDAGRIVPPADAHTLTAALQDMLTLDERSHAQLSKAARQRIMDNFSLSVIVRNYEKLYQGFIEGREFNIFQGYISRL